MGLFILHYFYAGTISIIMPQNKICMKKVIFLFFLTFPILVFSQNNADTDSIKSVINRFFDGLHKGDTLIIKQTVADSMILQTVATNREGVTRIRNESTSGFFRNVANRPANITKLEERITFDAIHIDASLASVWTPYKFFINDQFSHCGCNSFQLVKLNGRWLIQYIIDTRRRAGCE
jgi:hypothetical protein